jgi:DNA modification methylase
MKRNHFYIGDASEIIQKYLPDNSIHCVITSPPYFGLRSYLDENDPNKNKEIGLEKTPEYYVNNLVKLFQEIKRVLHPQGVVWINIGDSYNGSGKVGKKHNPDHVVFGQKIGNKTYGTSTHIKGLKPKDLIGIPWKVAFALQADGWYLRSDIIWSKPNPMPEPVTDRPTKNHEYIFLLSKSRQYWYDYVAIQEKSIYAGDKRGNRKDSRRHTNCNNMNSITPEMRNKRSVWTVATQPFYDAHFAVFPPKLIEPCVLAGCPEKCCPKCGAGWIRITKKKRIKISNSRKYKDCSLRNDTDNERFITETKTIKFEPSCKCNCSEFVPGIILDPFFGSGTTGVVANKYGRDYIGIDLDQKNKKIIKKRKITKGLFSMSELKIKESTHE